MDPNEPREEKGRDVHRFRREDGDEGPAKSKNEAGNGQTKNINPVDADIQPYAIAYLCEDHIGFTPENGAQPSNPENGASPPNPWNGAQPPNPENGASPPNPWNGAQPPNPENSAQPPNPENGVHPAYLENGAQPPNPENGAQLPNLENALKPNPMYVPNVPKHAACGCTCQRVGIAALAGTLCTLLIVGSIFGGLYNNNVQNVQKTVADNGLFGGRASTLTSETSQEATLPPTSDSSQERSSRFVDSDPEKITFGGKGRGPGKFEEARGVAV
ncbi:Hypp2799 [Branchiostoma lanceolatum]|uniref:Hypp2799 protein n=1 Tax=Branchiostoma lanceolatum TaxID=7740 RepID=A0A8K0ES14_BRALA|nr:Hypp2799 [Branchiostoma lanceolatum]